VRANARQVELIHDGHGALKMLDPLRLRILEELRSPESAAGVARKLNLPRQKVNYHLRELEKHGFVEQVEERRKGNCTERIVRATARYYLILPQAVGQLAVEPSAIEDHFSSTYLVAVAAEAIREVAYAQKAAKKSAKKLATLTVQSEIQFASAADRSAFAEELSNAVAKIVRKYHTDENSGRRFKLFLGMYPSIPKEETA
jgi:DNA-binding transcriptional ArsR family regulator